MNEKESLYDRSDAPVNDLSNAISTYGKVACNLTNNKVVKDQPRQCRRCDFNEYFCLLHIYKLTY